jgi:hypothetical protein
MSEKRLPSNQFRLGLADCPRCNATGEEPTFGGPCGYCDGAKKVTLVRFNNYIGLKPTEKPE